MGRLRYLAWALLASTGMTLSNAAIAQPVPTTPPVAPAELGDGPIDEVAQLERIRSALREHYRPDNDDTRFVIDRNDKGIFSVFSGVGLVHKLSNDDPGETRIGTGTIISPCFVLTSYHVAEGRELIDGDKLPLQGRRMLFSVGAIPGRTDFFLYKSLPVTVQDPHIFNFSNRRWSDDFVLLRFDNRIRDGRLQISGLSHVLGRSLPTQSLMDGSIKSFFVVGGFPASAIERRRRFDIYGDFCQIYGAVQDLGLSSNCVLTKGMSGGPMFYAEREGSQNYQLSLVAVPIQASVGSGEFAKESSGTSVLAPLTPAKIAKIRAIIDRPTDAHCMPTDGKPW